MEIAPELTSKVADLLTRTSGTLASNIGIEWLRFAKNQVVGRLPVDSRTKQPFGLLHGGASVALAESLASIGAWLNVDEDKFFVVGMEINANHLSAQREGWVRGVAQPLHIGSKTQVWEIKISSETSGKLACVSRCTLAVVAK